MRARFLSLLLLLSACQSGVEPENRSLDVRIQGSEFVISAPEGVVDVPFSATNHGETSVWVSRCGERLMTVLDRREGGEWVQVSSDRCLANQRMDPVELGSGQVLAGQRGVFEPGEYRLHLPLAVSRAGREMWYPVSNRFTVR